MGASSLTWEGGAKAGWKEEKRVSGAKMEAGGAERGMVDGGGGNQYTKTTALCIKQSGPHMKAPPPPRPCFPPALPPSLPTYLVDPVLHSGEIGQEGDDEDAVSPVDGLLGDRESDDGLLENRGQDCFDGGNLQCLVGLEGGGDGRREGWREGGGVGNGDGCCRRRP
jgi:hypothetical protein